MGVSDVRSIYLYYAISHTSSIYGRRSVGTSSQIIFLNIKINANLIVSKFFKFSVEIAESFVHGLCRIDPDQFSREFFNFLRVRSGSN